MEQSTPISSLTDNSENVVNNILNKYNSLQNDDELEQKFENRDLNKEIFDGRSDNTPYKEHYNKEKERVERFHNNNKEQIEQNDDDDDEDDQYEEYEEYEVIELPLWKRVLNELRTIFFIFLSILLIFNSTVDKTLIVYLPFLGNKYNECNTKGFLLKSFVIAILSYLFIRFIHF